MLLLCINSIAKLEAYFCSVERGREDEGRNVEGKMEKYSEQPREAKDESEE